MKIKVQLPIRLEVRDYHEFDSIRRNFLLLNPKIHVREVKYVDINGTDGQYIGMAYVGKLTDKENADMYQEIGKELGE